MRWSTLVLLGMALLYGGWPQAYGEVFTYYVWTDDQGVTHAGDTPPVDHAYETRTIEVETNGGPAAPPAGAASSQGGSGGGGKGNEEPAGTTTGNTPAPTDSADLPTATEEQQRLEQQPGFNAGGAPTAPGAKAAPSSPAASSSGTATGAPAAAGSATAPGSPIAPPPVTGGY